MSALRQLRARAAVALWAWTYDLEQRREAAAQEQRNLRCAGYCLLLAACAVIGMSR